jgi:hypothetical protein
MGGLRIQGSGYGQEITLIWSIAKIKIKVPSSTGRGLG